MSVAPMRAPSSRLPPVDGPVIRLPPIERPARLQATQGPEPEPSSSQSHGANCGRQFCCRGLLPFRKAKKGRDYSTTERPAAETEGGESTTAAAVAGGAESGGGGPEVDTSQIKGRPNAGSKKGRKARDKAIQSSVVTAELRSVNEHFPPIENMCYRALYAMGIDVDDYVSIG